MGRPVAVPDEVDVAVVGGGPAGLAAALWLGRYRREVVVFDDDAPRNRFVRAVHGYPGVPDTPPAELRARMRRQAAAAGARYVLATVVDVHGRKDGFVVERRDAAPVHARRLLLAYGRQDVLPEIPGLRERFGLSVFHCPDCDAPGIAGEPTAVLGADLHAAALALFLRTWTDRLVLLAHGRAPRLDPETRATLEREGIGIEMEPVERLVGPRGGLDHVVLAGGRRIRAGALFVHLESNPAADLAERLGCHRVAGHIVTDQGQETSVPGVFAAGDITRGPHLAITAAAQGVTAALSMHRSLLPPSFNLPQ